MERPPEKAPVSEAPPVAGGFPSDILRLAEACRYEKSHSLQVVRLSLVLFDALAGLHRLDEQEKKWLRFGALLHDIGWIRGQKKHHKAALELILKADLPSLSAEEKIIVGLLARYHRKAIPKDSHDHFKDLPKDKKQTVLKLAALIRLADGLDRTHGSVIEKLTCDIGQEEIVVRVTKSAGFSEDDKRSGEKKADLFEKVFERKLRIAWSAGP